MQRSLELLILKCSFPTSKLEIAACNEFTQGQDIALLLKLAIQSEPATQSKSLAEGLSISPSEVSKALRRCADAGLVHVEGSKKRVNRTALMEFLSHGLRYVFPPERGSMVRGIPTAAAAEPLKSRLPEDNEPLQSGRMPKEKCAVFLSSPFIRARLRQLYEI